MSRKYIVATVIVLCTKLAFCQKTSNTEQEVIKKVEEYFEGYAKGDSILLKKVFHEDFRLSWRDPWRHTLAHADRSGLFNFFGSHWSNLKIESEIEEVATTENSAYCRAKVTLKGMVIWTDHISLLKLPDDRWWIISKVSEGKIIN